MTTGRFYYYPSSLIVYDRIIRQAAVLLVLGVLVACGSSSGGTSTGPSPTPTQSPSGGTTTDTFSGTVAVGGTDSHNFTVSAFGEVDVTLTSAGPPSTIVMGLGVGIVSGAACVLVSTVTTQAGANPQLTGTANPGQLCVSVFDSGGGQTGPVTYSVTVKHP